MFGIFNDEGRIEGDFASAEEAEAVRAREYTADEHVAEQCPEHPDEEREWCPECEAGGEEE